MAIDLLNLTPQVISKDLRSKYILLAGAPKIGKTEFCTQSPDALIFATEIGTNARPGAMVQPITKWSDFKLALRQLENDAVKAKFSTVCIDTITILYDLCEQFICAQNGVQKIGDIPYGAGYTQTSKEFENSLRKITMLGYGLIMTCHLKESMNEEGQLVACKPDLNNRCLKIVNGLVDIIGVITQSWNDKGESQRWVRTRSTPIITAGTRYKYMKPIIPFGYDEFVKAVVEAIEEEEKRGAVVVDEAPLFSAEVLDFDEIFNKAKSLWSQLIGSCENEEEQVQMAKRLQKKIEMIFGRQMKLSEVTEDQTDLLNLMVIEMKEMVK